VGNVDADAPPARERPSPAAPSAGTAAAFVTRFRFEACFTRGIVASSMTHLKCCQKSSPQSVRLAHLPRKLDNFTKSLWYIQFLFILINGSLYKLINGSLYKSVILVIALAVHAAVVAHAVPG
jgi:hypothetical protein